MTGVKAGAVLLAGTTGGTALLWRWLRAGPVPGGSTRWQRTNHAGASVTLLEGVALVTGTTAGLLASRAVLARMGSGRPAGWSPAAHEAAVLAVLSAAAAGLVDDLRQDTRRKGLTGHLRALAGGELTTGALKMLVLGASATGSVWWSDREDRGRREDNGGRAGIGGRARVVDTLAGAAVVAGAANLANLFDLRPGRAIKAGALPGLALLLTGGSSPAAAAVTGAGLALLPEDLAGRAMLGDTGSNPLGAALGIAAVQRQGRTARLVTLCAIAALTVLSERVSFSVIIDAVPLLRALDGWGRPTG